MSDTLIYIDESGNAGANLLDQHPFFTLAGVAMLKEDIPDIENALISVKQGLGLPSGSEVKGAHALRHDLHQLVIQSAETLLGKGCPIFWDVVERRFMIAAIIVDNLFDHVYNDAVGPEWTVPSQKRQNLANHFYNHLSDETMTLAARCLVGGNSSEIRRLIKTIEIEMTDDSEVDGFYAVAALDGVRPHIDELAGVIRQSSQRRAGDPLRSHRGALRSPNLTSFYVMMNMIEDYYRDEPLSIVHIVFDSSPQFDEAFRHLHSLLVQADEVEIRYPGRTPMLFGFQRVQSFHTADSEVEPLLQMADLFSSGIRSVFELIQSPTQPTTIGKSMDYFLNFVVSSLELNLFNYVISDNVARKMIPTFNKYPPP